MEVFSYKAMNEQGQILQGKVDAINVADLEIRLGKMGLDLINYKGAGSKRLSVTGRGVRRRDLITFCFHLEQLVRAGVPLLQALTDLRDSVEDPRLREVSSALMESIEGGKTLSQAMEDFPAVFSQVFCNLVRAGEDSGQLAEVLRHVTESLKWQDEQAAYTKKLLMYPALVAVVVISVLCFLMIYLVPQLLTFITHMHGKLPLHTKLLIIVSHAFVNYWYLILGLPILAVALTYLAMRLNPTVHYRVDALKLKLPVIGPILKKLILNRLVNYFAMMYASGITVLECMRVGERIAGNKAVEAAVHDAGRQIADGNGISASFKSTGLFPPLVIRMLRVGENTGALETALLNISYFYSRDVKESIERLQTMIEPTMTLILGGLLAWVMFSVLGPIYDLISKLKV